MEDELKNMKARLIWSFVFLIPLFYLSMGHMMGWPIPHFFHGAENAMTYALTLFLLTVPIMVINQKYYRVGFKTLWHLSPNMDSLIAVGSAAAVVYGAAALYCIGWGLGHGDMALVEHYSMDLYFESAGMILTLITLGKYLETRSKGKTGQAIARLMDLTPKTATVLRDGGEAEVPVEQVQAGDLMLVRPGASVPVDGVVVEGASSVDESALTGESIPVDKGPGDTVISASINKSGVLTLRATRVGEDTTLAQMIRLVDEAASSKAPIAKLADRVAGLFVPVVMVIALITAVVWMAATGSVERALTSGVAVLVISCPCALGLATPVAIMVGSGVGAKNGILFKTASSLEAAGRTEIVALDKTGTITRGEPRVTDILPAEGVDGAELLRLAAALERRSEHPLAKAVLRRAEEDGIPAEEVTDFQALPGNGLNARWNGALLSGGSLAFISTRADVPQEFETRASALAGQGKTPLFFCRDKALLGVIAVADVMKEDSPQAVRELQSMGIRVVMLTGDNQRTADAIGRQAGVDEVIAGVLPDGKESVIRRLKEQGKVAMVGDGINDAPALTRADTGIAIGAGTDVAIDAADVVLMKSRLSDVPAAIRLSRATLRNIHQNLFWAFFYNTIGVPLAAGLFIPLGLTLNPMFGAAAMSLSSFCVVSNALRLNLFDIRDAGRDKKVRVKHKEEAKTMEKTMKIEGMMCGHCEARVKKALEALPEVAAAVVSHESGTAVVTLSGELSDAALKKAVEDQDYQVTGIQ